MVTVLPTASLPDPLQDDLPGNELVQMERERRNAQDRVSTLQGRSFDGQQQQPTTSGWSAHSVRRTWYAGVCASYTALAISFLVASSDLTRTIGFAMSDANVPPLPFALFLCLVPVFLYGWYAAIDVVRAARIAERCSFVAYHAHRVLCFPVLVFVTYHVSGNTTILESVLLAVVGAEIAYHGVVHNVVTTCRQGEWLVASAVVRTCHQASSLVLLMAMGLTFATVSGAPRDEGAGATLLTCETLTVLASLLYATRGGPAHAGVLEGLLTLLFLVEHVVIVLLALVAS